MPDSLIPLTGKTTLITGVSSGIGHAIASTLVSAGATVYGTSRRSENLPKGIHHIPADLTDEEQLSVIFDQIPLLDILINNAGIAHLSRISDGDPALWEEMWKLNVHATALSCQKALPLMTSHGCIINVCSISGHRIPPTGGFYAPTKFAVRAITDALREELANDPRHLRVATLSPGFVDTPILDKYFSGREKALAQTKASLKMLASQDVADTVLHMITAPPHVAFDDIRIRSAEQKG